MDIDPEAPVSSLIPSEKVAVAVARALQERVQGSGVVVFDESSRAIPHEALADFHAMVRFLARSGTSVLIVTHDLKEVLHLTDRVTALHNGKVVQMGVSTASLDEAALTRLALGREGVVDDLVTTIPARLGADEIRLEGLAGGLVHDLTTTVRAGQVVGITGDGQLRPARRGRSARRCPAR